MDKYHPKAILQILFFTSLTVLTVMVWQIASRSEQSFNLKKNDIQVELTPDFANILDVDLKKESFFNFLQPYIDANSSLILTQREALVTIQSLLLEGSKLSQKDKNFLLSISDEYKVTRTTPPSAELLSQLLLRVDIIPSSLTLAQAANESAWGTSRFARDGNNFFGQWCYQAGCGFVPAKRSVDKTHEVKRFANVAESVRAYNMNLNTFSGYETLRNIRQQLRINDKYIDGISLSAGLLLYSERGEAYIKELQDMIYSNKLLERD